jgi:hypothetical protein
MWRASMTAAARQALKVVLDGLDRLFLHRST